MDFFEFMEQYKFSKEEETREKIWHIWANLYPNFTQESFISFPDFYNKIIGKTEKKEEKNRKLSGNGKTDEQRIAEAEEILRKMEFVEKK